MTFCLFILWKESLVIFISTSSLPILVVDNSNFCACGSIFMLLLNSDWCTGLFENVEHVSVNRFIFICPLAIYYFPKSPPPFCFIKKKKILVVDNIKKKKNLGVQFCSNQQQKNGLCKIYTQTKMTLICLEVRI